MPRLSAMTCGKVQAVCTKEAMRQGECWGVLGKCWRCSKNSKKLGWVKSIQEPFTLQGLMYSHICVSLLPQPHPVTQSVRNLDGTGAGWGPEEAAGSHREAITLRQRLIMCSYMGEGTPQLSHIDWEFPEVPLCYCRDICQMRGANRVGEKERELSSSVPC